MGKEIVYCGGCGKSLREEEFARGKAHTVDNRPYCVACKPLPAAAPTPRPAHPVVRETAPPSPTTPRRGIAPAREPRSSHGLLIGGIVAVALVVVVLVVLASSGGSPKPEPQPPPDPVAPPPPPSARKPATSAASAPAPPLADLEALAASGGDPDVILQKCDELRPALKGTPGEARLAAVEQRALEARKARDLDRKITRSLDDARRMIEEPSAVERREEIIRLLKATREIAGNRQAEVDRLAAQLDQKVKEAAAKPPPPPPPPPPTPAATAVVSLTLINADTEKPVAGFDPIPAQATINLGTVGTRNLNVRANLEGKPGSVRFDLDGAVFSIENAPPFALAGGTPTDYLPWTPRAGRLTITATPFSLVKAAGVAGTAHVVVVQIVDPAPEDLAVSFQDGVSPTPAYAGTRDTELDEAKPQVTAGNARKLEMEGDIGGQGKDRVALFRWDLTSIPAGRLVREASVTFTVVGSGSSATFPIVELKRDWAERGSSWNLSAPGKPWETPGALGAQDRGAALGSLLAKKLGIVTVPLDAAVVQGWIDRPASNFGFIISNSETHDALQVNSRECLSPADRPKLTIHFHPAGTRKVLFSENFNGGRGKFPGGDPIDGALSIGKSGVQLDRLLPSPISSTLTVRFRIKPLFGIGNFEVLANSVKAEANAWYRVRGLKANEWNTVEVRVAEMKVGYLMKGPSLEGDSTHFLKLYFDDGAPEARVLIDDFELLE